MSTEEETFRRLKRIPWEEVHERFNCSYEGTPNQFWEETGWSYKEYDTERNKRWVDRLNSRRNIQSPT